VPGPFPKILPGKLGLRAVAVNEALIRLSKSLFSYQIYVEAESTPHVDFVLRDSKERSAARARDLAAHGPTPAASKP
jgi:hypothetical protein